MIDVHAHLIALGSLVSRDPGTADTVGHQLVVIVVVICTTVLVGLKVVDTALAGTVYGAALGFSGGLGTRRRVEDYAQALPGGARRQDPPAPH